jgi:hypothetical protein
MASSSSSLSKEVPDNFFSVMHTFVQEMKTTFPEYAEAMQIWWPFTSLEEEKKEKEQKVQELFAYCKPIYIERFFDILYLNAEIFDATNTTVVNTCFLPGIDFKQCWVMDISEQTKQAIWAHLQCVLMCVISSVDDSAAFGQENGKLFEAIDAEQLQSKLKETFENMQRMFADQQSSSSAEGEGEGEQKESSSSSSMPFGMNPEFMDNHLKKLFGSKIGALAVELAKEAAEGELPGQEEDVFKKLLQNPTKLMTMVKKIESRINEKIAKGEINKDELMTEGMDLLNSMKDMPDIMAQIGKMFGGKAKVNVNAMNSHMKQAQTRERMRANVAARQFQKEQERMQKEAAQAAAATAAPALSDKDLIRIFSVGPKPVKSSREPSSSSSSAGGGSTKGQSQSGKKKKGKK